MVGSRALLADTVRPQWHSHANWLAVWDTCVSTRLGPRPTESCTGPAILRPGFLPSSYRTSQTESVLRHPELADVREACGRKCLRFQGEAHNSGGRFRAIGAGNQSGFWPHPLRPFSFYFKCSLEGGKKLLGLERCNTEVV